MFTHVFDNSWLSFMHFPQFYQSVMYDFGWSKDSLVRFAKELIMACGATEPPQVDESILRKLGLLNSDVRSSSRRGGRSSYPSHSSFGRHNSSDTGSFTSHRQHSHEHHDGRDREGHRDRSSDRSGGDRFSDRSGGDRYSSRGGSSSRGPRSPIAIGQD